MTYNPPPPRKSHKGLYIALSFLGLALLLFCCAGVVSQVAPGGKGSDKGLTVVDPSDVSAPQTGAGTSPAAVARAVRASDIHLKVKIKSKECFGSAGCLLEYSIDASWNPSLVKDDCEVTYDVTGFKDGAQTHTLTVREDGHYEQDIYQSGDTSSSSRKLGVKVTEVDCS
jgi:hypothetical protein